MPNNARKYQNEVNERLPDIILYHETWREQTLEKLLAKFDDLERPPVDCSLVKPIGPN